MKRNAQIGTAVAIALAAMTLAACDREGAAQADRTGATAGQKLDNALDRTKQELSVAGAKTKETLDAAGNKIAAATDRAVAQTAMSDTAITASVKTDFLKDPDLSVLKIDVDTRDGVVTLNGLAENEAARKRAEQMASSVKGVKEVRNYLTVKRT